MTKTAAEDLCELVHAEHGLPVVVLRTARFFPEGDDRDEVRAAYPDANVKANEYLYRRVDVADVADAHLLAMDRAARIGFGKYILSATTPFTPADLAGLRDDAPAVVRRLFPDYEAEYARRGWRMFPSIGRVYVNAPRPRRAGLVAPLRLPRRARRAQGRARTRAARSPGPSARRATTPSPPGRTRSADRDARSSGAGGLDVVRHDREQAVYRMREPAVGGDAKHTTIVARWAISTSP